VLVKLRFARTAAWISSALLAAAALAAAQPAPPDPASVAGRRYLLLLLEDARYQAASGAALTARIEEYRRWSKETPGVEAGDKLADSGWSLSEKSATAVSARPAKGFVAGLFIIRAAGDAEAIRVAQSCPHLAHGGQIELRPIE